MAHNLYILDPLNEDYRTMVEKNVYGKKILKIKYRLRIWRQISDLLKKLV